ncbi:hypothetical protein [Azospirillum sp. B4]|uniref:hypothetical protein n=1 Tax=Azospirillum sp. B4 TaxID=95605 RepID=UPI0011DD8B62|nr:hypothetical protein [Azospirillum sp. B4]
MGNDPVSTRPVGGSLGTPAYSKAPASRTDSDFQKTLARTAAADQARASQASAARAGATTADTVRISQQTMLSGLAAYNMAAQASPVMPGYQRPTVRVGDNVTTKNEKSDKGAFRLSPSRELQGRAAYAKALQSQAPAPASGALQNGDAPAAPATNVAPSGTADSSQAPAEQGKVADRSSVNIVL